MKKTHEESVREWLSGFRGYRDNSPAAKQRRHEAMMERIDRELHLRQLKKAIFG